MKDAHPLIFFSLCLLTATYALLLFCLFIGRQNDLILLRQQIPALEADIDHLSERIIEERSFIEAAYSPQKLLQHTESDAMGHLKPAIDAPGLCR